jgi:hypothetical protein
MCSMEIAFKSNGLRHIKHSVARTWNGLKISFMWNSLSLSALSLTLVQVELRIHWMSKNVFFPKQGHRVNILYLTRNSVVDSKHFSKYDLNYEPVLLIYSIHQRHPNSVQKYCRTLGVMKKCAATQLAKNFVLSHLFCVASLYQWLGQSLTKRYVVNVESAEWIKNLS